MANNPKAKPIVPEEAGASPLPIMKPPSFSLDKFKSKRAATPANVETALTALPHHGIAQAKDYVRLHPDEDEYWSTELCFVSVPIKGAPKEQLHLIDDDLTVLLASGKVQRFRLALATKPHDIFFLCHIPTTNTDNSWNMSNVAACLRAKEQWCQVTSRKGEGADCYKVDYARDQDAFPEPKWLRATLDEIIHVTFLGRMIDHDEHPGMLRLLGAKQNLT